MRLVWTLVLQLSYLTMAIPSVTQEGESILEPPRERFERSISEQEERVKELLDNFKAEMLGKFQEQDRRIATQEQKISRQSETISKLEETIAGQQKTIEEQNETIQMIVTHLDLLQDSGSSSEAEESLLLITGGHASDSFSSVEVFPSTSGCSPPDLPAGRHTHTTFLTSGLNPVVATCGGEVGDGYTVSCLVLDKSNHRWDESRMGNLTIFRRKAAAATLNSVGVFIIGGVATNNERTSDFLAAGTMQWQEGPALPVDMWEPCAVTITPTSFLAIYEYHIREFDAAIDGPTSIDGWREAGSWPRLKTSRTYWPGCAKIGQKVIIAGGYNNGEALRSSEVLDLDSREITAGEDMASPRCFFHLATIRRGGLEKVLAVGGRDASSYVNTVEELVEVEESTTWRKADSFLGRSLFGAEAFPEEFLCPA